MDSVVLKAMMLIALPFVVFMWGGYALERLGGREEIDKRLGNTQGLGMRFRGYDSAVVTQRWSALAHDPDLLKYERLGLELDLVFPFLYGSALAAALLCAWAALDRPFPPVLLILPVALGMLADWTENCVQLGQLKLFEMSHDSLQPGWIQIASAATMTKLFFLCSSSLLLIVLTGLMIVRGFAHRS